MSTSQVQVASITGDGDASEKQSFTFIYHTTKLASINHQPRAVDKEMSGMYPATSRTAPSLNPPAAAGEYLPGAFEQNLKVTTECRMCGEWLMII